MAGTLYIVATPIGNLDDMPPRVAATFGAADFIAAEDTRVTMKLLNFLGLKKPMVSYYEHALQKGEGILRRDVLYRPGVAGADLLHKDPQPLGEGVGAVPGVSELFVVHVCGLLVFDDLLSAYSELVKRSIFFLLFSVEIQKSMIDCLHLDGKDLLQ